MKKRNGILHIGLMACFCIAILEIQAEASQGDVTDISTVDSLNLDGPFDKIWQPYLAKWTDEQYLATYGLQIKGKGDMGDIVCSISQDSGKTWGPRITIFDHRIRNGSTQYAYANPVLFRVPSQNVIWIYCMRVPVGFRNSENSKLVAAYTADGGYSWQHVELAMGYQGPLIIVGGIHIWEKDGVDRYLLPAHRNSRRGDETGDRRQFVLESSSLVRWDLAGYVPVEDPVFLHEGSIASIGEGGDLKMVMRTADVVTEQPLESGLAYSSVSRDGGRSWSIAQPESLLPNHRAKGFYGRDSLGRHVYVYNDEFERRALRYKIQSSGGAWSGSRVFYSNDNRNSYPTLIEDTPGNWLAVWDSSDTPERKRTLVRFGRLNLGQ